MKVRITLTLSDQDRRAIRQYYGKPGLATWDESASLCEALVKADLESIYQENDTEETCSTNDDKENSNLAIAKLKPKE